MRLRIAQIRELNKLHADLGKLNSELDLVEPRKDGQDMSEELLCVVLTPKLSTSGMPHRDGRTAFRIDLCQAFAPSLSQTLRMFTSIQ